MFKVPHTTEYTLSYFSVCTLFYTQNNVCFGVHVQWVPWSLKLKLIAVTSLSIHAITSEGCVTNGLERRNTWAHTEICTLEKSGIHVVSVRNVSCLYKHCVFMWIFIQINTSAQNVANAVTVVQCWQYTGEVIPEKNRLSVLFVANDLHSQVTLLRTTEFTVERNRLSVLIVANDLYIQVTLKCTSEFTVERNRFTVLFVANDLHGQVTLLHTKEFTVERNRLSVLFVASDLYCQVTLKCTAEFTCRNSYLDIKMWSHMLTVNIHCRSIQQLHWNLIWLYMLPITNSFAVVNVVNILSTKMMLYNTLRDVLMTDWVLSVFLNHVYLSNHKWRSHTNLLMVIRKDTVEKCILTFTKLNYWNIKTLWELITNNEMMFCHFTFFSSSP